MQKTRWPLILMLLLVAADLMAAGDGHFTSMEDGIDSARQTAQGLIGHAIWILAFIPIGIGYWAWKTAKEHLENKEETSQFEPKWQKLGKLIAAALGGVAITFLAYGIIGGIFFGKGFMDTWNLLVVSFWNEAITFAR
ncbi:MAG: hypothetical protein PHT07_10640 [Paludibacter sp.]|nr:hypothetical protein [Paludibacter sp.]